MRIYVLKNLLGIEIDFFRFKKVKKWKCKYLQKINLIWGVNREGREGGFHKYLKFKNFGLENSPKRFFGSLFPFSRSIFIPTTPR